MDSNYKKRITAVILSCSSPDHFSNCRSWVRYLSDKRLISTPTALQMSELIDHCQELPEAAPRVLPFISKRRRLTEAAMMSR